MRGEYRWKNGLIVPNHLTGDGQFALLTMALRGTDGVTIGAGANFYFGLASVVPEVDTELADISEPSIGTNGYGRKAVTRDADGWPNAGNVDGIPYLETDDLIWVATGGDYDQEITRMFMTPEATATTGEVWSISEAIETPLVIGTATAEEDRTFRYRIYQS